jgi:hypothetical protein
MNGYQYRRGESCVIKKWRVTACDDRIRRRHRLIDTLCWWQTRTTSASKVSLDPQASWVALKVAIYCPNFKWDFTIRGCMMYRSSMQKLHCEHCGYGICFVNATTNSRTMMVLVELSQKFGSLVVAWAVITLVWWLGKVVQDMRRNRDDAYEPLDITTQSYWCINNSYRSVLPTSIATITTSLIRGHNAECADDNSEVVVLTRHVHTQRTIIWS